MQKNYNNLGITKNLYNNIDKNKLNYLTSVFKKMSYCRIFEEKIRNIKNEGKIKNLVYLSIGQESIASSLSCLIKNPWLFFQHRGHSNYLCFGGDQKKLIDELLEKKTGSNKGYGGSPPIQDFKKRIIGHSGLIGDHVPVACGLSLKTKKNDITLCIFGDGAAEEDYVLASLGFAGSKKLRILFICEDNDMSVLTPISDRRNWKIHEVAKSFKINACEITDDPLLIKNKVDEYKDKLPALINIKTCRDVWHEGTGSDGEPLWSRYKILKTFLSKKHKINVKKIENLNKRNIEKLWKKQLQIQ